MIKASEILPLLKAKGLTIPARKEEGHARHFNWEIDDETGEAELHIYDNFTLAEMKIIRDWLNSIDFES